MNEHLENIKKFLESQGDSVLQRFRTERNRRLAETDWWVLPDRTPTQAQLDYRQALRDLPSKASSDFTNQKITATSAPVDMSSITFPKKPD